MALQGRHIGASGVRAAPGELLLQVVDRNLAFRDCNYSLYPSWLAYPWANAHLVIRGTLPYSLDRCDRVPPRGDSAGGSTSLSLEGTMQYFEGLDAAGVATAVLDFARSAPRPARVLLNLNTSSKQRRVTGLLSALGCRLASVGRSGELSTLGGLAFTPALAAEPGGPGRSSGLRVRHRILIQPDAHVHLAVPRTLAEAARKRPRPGQRIERIDPLPSVFTDSATFRTLWPDAPGPAPGRRYRLLFEVAGNDTRIEPEAADEDGDVVPLIPQTAGAHLTPPASIPVADRR
jgi:hypothetical protein